MDDPIETADALAAFFLRLMLTQETATDQGESGD